MADGSIYERLAQHLDQGIVGAPESQSLLEILKILFPPEEAGIAVKLPMEDKTLAELQELFPEVVDSLGDFLTAMAKRGTVFTSQRPGQERKYRLLPSVVGWAETPGERLTLPARRRQAVSRQGIGSPSRIQEHHLLIAASQSCRPEFIPRFIAKTPRVDFMAFGGAYPALLR